MAYPSPGQATFLTPSRPREHPRACSAGLVAARLWQHSQNQATENYPAPTLRGVHDRDQRRHCHRRRRSRDRAKITASPPRIEAPPSTAAAIEGLKLLGSPPNVRIKISALTAYDPRPTPESLRDVALHCIECFGVDRSMFGSDFPVGRLWTSFDAIFDGFKAIARDFSEAEQSALFRDNARREYRVDAATVAA
jgi:hypothetical protein